MGDDGDDTGGTEPSSAEGSAKAPVRRRWWQTVVLGTLVLVVAGFTLVVMRGAAFVRSRAEAQLAERWGASVQIDEVEIHWTELLIEMTGIRFDDGHRLEVDIERVEIQLGWSDLVTTERRPAVTIFRPHISFEAKPGVERESDGRRAPQFGSLQIIDGSLEVELNTTRGPIYVDLTEIEARVDQRDSVRLDLGVEAAARVGEAGRITARGRTSSKAPAEAWSFRFSVERFELAALNQLWLDLLEMDVDRGVLSIEGELTRTASRLRGRIQPHFEDVALLGADEQALHPMAEALFGHMLMGASSTLPIDRPMTADHGSSLAELLDTDWQTIIQDVIKRGYSRRLNKLRGFQARIEDVRVDFSQGLLQLINVVIDSEDPLIEVPLVSIDRVDVVFDPAVTVPGASAFKHVTLWGPTLTFATGVETKDNQLQFDETWIDTISAIPFATRDLVVHDGRLDVWDIRGEEPVNVFVDGIELEGREMARSLHASGVRGAQLVGTGRILDETEASIRIVYEPRPIAANLDVDMRVEPMPLTSLAPALQTFAGVDAIGGTVGFSAHISARDYGVEASVVPEVHRPQLKAMGGRRLRKLVLERALRHLKSHVIELRYRVEPDEGVLHEFFPALIKSVFLGR